MSFPRLSTPASLLALTLVLGGCGGAAVSGPAEDAPPPEGRFQVAAFLGEHRIPPGTQFAGTTVGGFSGLDRDPESGTWFVVSDDRSALAPARFYTADLRFDGPDGMLSGVELTATTPPPSTTSRAWRGAPTGSTAPEPSCWSATTTSPTPR